MRERLRAPARFSLQCNADHQAKMVWWSRRCVVSQRSGGRASTDRSRTVLRAGDRQRFICAAWFQAVFEKMAMQCSVGDFGLHNRVVLCCACAWRQL